VKKCVEIAEVDVIVVIVVVIGIVHGIDVLIIDVMIFYGL